MKDASGTGSMPSPPPQASDHFWSRIGKLLGIALLSSTMLVGAAIPAAAAELMRVTFVRHGQSAGNASGLIDTSTPGPVITQQGQAQSEAVVGRLGVNNYDGVYASTMQRTQQTAGPLSRYLHLPVRVLPGVHEIEAGDFEGTPESEAANGYGRYPLAWALQGNRDLRIPGSIDGNEFDARMDGSLQEIYDNGDRNAVVFSHGGAIMFWTMMNATNLTVEQKLDLLRYAPLSNTHYVVVEGNPVDGWKLVDWNGQKFAPDATLAAEVRLQLRTLQRQLSGAVTQVVASFATLNPAKVLAAIADSFSDTVVSIAKFAGAVNNKLATEWAKKAEPSATVQSAATASAEPAVEETAPAVQAAALDRQTPKTAAVHTDSGPSDSAPKAAAVAVETVTEDVAPVTESETPAEAVVPETPEEAEAVEVPTTATPAKAPRTAKSALTGATTAKKASAGNPRAKAGANSAG